MFEYPKTIITKKSDNFEFFISWKEVDLFLFVSILKTVSHFTFFILL